MSIFLFVNAYPEMAFLPNPPKADESLRLSREMFIPLNAQPIQLGRILFHWGYTQKIILGISFIFLWLFFSHAFHLRQKAMTDKRY